MYHDETKNVWVPYPGRDSGVAANQWWEVAQVDTYVCAESAQAWCMQALVCLAPFECISRCAESYTLHLDTLFWNSSERTQQQTLLITNGVLFLPKGLWSLFRPISFPSTCFSTCLVMSFAVQRISDFASTPYVLRQQHGIKVIPPPVTCVILMMTKMSSIHVLFHCANPHVISLRRKYASLFPPTGAHDVFNFLSQNNNKLYFFLHELIAFYE